MNNYYVYEILIDDIVRYVGISQKRDFSYDKSDPHYWARLKDHGYFMSPITARKRIENNKLGRRKELVLAKANNQKISYNIVLDEVTAEEAGKKEQELINQYGMQFVIGIPTEKNGECYIERKVIGQLTNKINSPITIVNNNKGGWHKTEGKGEGTKKWYASLTEEERAENSERLRQQQLAYMKRCPDKFWATNKKAIEASRLACCKETRSEETFRKQSENMKKRWARNEYWIEAKNKLSSEVLKRLNENPEFREASRQRTIERNKDPELQLRKVCKLRKAIIDNNKDLTKWEESHRELVAEGKFPLSGYRDWKKYFASEEEMINFYNTIYEN